MPATAYVVGLVFILQALGCTAGGTQSEPDPRPGGPGVTGQQPVDVVRSQPVPAEAVPMTVKPAAVTNIDPSPEPQSGPQPSGSVRDAPVVEPSPAADLPRMTPALKETPAETAPPAAKPPVKIAIPPPPSKPVVAAPVRSEPPPPPPLALATLEQRLKDTDAVGVFTKLALKNQIDDLMEEIDERVKKNERVLVTTLTKRMAEELTKYLERADIKCRYIHSEVKTLDRVEILRELRLGIFDVLVGVNLLREGLDLPEVSLVTILDADKEGFLRNQRSLVQTIGRAARNENGKVIMYADTITESMQQAIDETNRRRKTQIDYNLKHGITPKTILRSKESILEQTKVADSKKTTKKYYIEEEEQSLAADPVISYLSKEELQKMADRTRKAMEKAAKELEFIEAARLRDEYLAFQKLIEEKTN